MPSLSGLKNYAMRINSGVATTMPTPGGLGDSVDIQGLIDRIATEEGIDANLLRAVVKTESNFNPNAMPPIDPVTGKRLSTAKGLTQLLDGTAKELGVTDPFNPEQNLRGGARYLKQHLTATNGNVDHALAMYNQGPGAAANGIPQAALPYIDKVRKNLGGVEPTFSTTEAPKSKGLTREGLRRFLDNQPDPPAKFSMVETIGKLAPTFGDGMVEGAQQLASNANETFGKAFVDVASTPTAPLGKLPFGVENKGGRLGQAVKDVAYGIPEGVMTLGAGIPGFIGGQIVGAGQIDPRNLTESLASAFDVSEKIATASMGHPHTATGQLLMKPIEVVFGTLLGGVANTVKEMSGPDVPPEELENRVKAAQYITNTLLLGLPMAGKKFGDRMTLRPEDVARSQSPEVMAEVKAQVKADPNVAPEVKAQVDNINVNLLDGIAKKAEAARAKIVVEKKGTFTVKFPENEAIVQGLQIEAEMRGGRAKAAMNRAAKIVADFEGDIATADLKSIKGINPTGSTGKAITKLIAERDALKKSEEKIAQGAGDDVPLDIPKAPEIPPEESVITESKPANQSGRKVTETTVDTASGILAVRIFRDPDGTITISDSKNTTTIKPDAVINQSALFENGKKISDLTDAELVAYQYEPILSDSVFNKYKKGEEVKPTEPITEAPDAGKAPRLSEEQRVELESQPDPVINPIEAAKSKLKVKESASEPLPIPEFDTTVRAANEGYTFPNNSRYAKLEKAQAKAAELGEGHEVIKVRTKYKVAKFKELPDVMEFADEVALNKAGWELMSEIPKDKLAFEPKPENFGSVKFGLAKVGDKYYRTSERLDMPVPESRMGEAVEALKKDLDEFFEDGVTPEEWAELKSRVDEATQKEITAKNDLMEIIEADKKAPPEVKTLTTAEKVKMFQEWRESYVTKCNEANRVKLEESSKPKTGVKKKKEPEITKESMAMFDDNFREFESPEAAEAWMQETGKTGEIIVDPLTGRASFMNTEKLKGLDELDVYEEGFEQLNGRSDIYSDGMLSSDDISYAFGDFFNKFKKRTVEIAPEIKVDNSIKVDVPSRYTDPVVEFPRSGNKLPSGEVPKTPFEDFLTTSNNLKDLVTRSVEHIEEGHLRALADKLADKINPEVTLTVVSPGVPVPGGVPAVLGSGAVGAVLFKKGSLPKAFLRTSEFGEAGTTPKTLLHEAIHTVVDEKLDHYNNVKYKDTPEGRAIQDLYALQNVIGKELNSRRGAPVDPNNRFGPKVSQVKHEMNNPALLEGTFNIREILTYGLTSPDFQAFLKSIPYKTGNVFNKFVDTIRKLLGLDVNSKTALDEVIRLGDEFIDMPIPDAGLSAEGIRNAWSVLNNERGSVDLTPLRNSVDVIESLVREAKKAGQAIDKYLESIGVDEAGIEIFKGALGNLSAMKQQLRDSDPTGESIFRPDGEIVAQTVKRTKTGKVTSVLPPITAELATKVMNADRNMAWGTDKIFKDPVTGKVKVEHTTNAFEKFMSSTETKINTFRAAGLSELYYKWREAKSAAQREKVELKGWLQSLKEQIPAERRKDFAIAAFADMKSVREAYNRMGITEIPTMSAVEARVFEQLLEFTRKMRERSNYVRTHTGQKAIPVLLDTLGRENYLPLMRDMNVLRDMGVVESMVLSDSATLGKLSKTFNGMFNPHSKKRNVSDIPIELDPFKTLERYIDYSIDEIHISPISALAKELANVKLPRVDGVKGKISLRDWNPSLSNALSNWSDYIVGKDIVNTALGNINTFFSNQLNKRSKNLVVAIIGGSIRTVLVQPTSFIIGVPTILNLRSAAYGVFKLMAERPFKGSNSRARRESSVLAIREAEYAYSELAEYIKSGLMSGGRAYLAEKSLVPMKWVDSIVAEASWNAAAYYGEKTLKLSGKELIRYADDVVERTQGLGIKGAVSDIQSGAATKWLTLLQTFGIADFNFIARDVLGIKNPEANISKTIIRVAKYIGATILTGQIYKMMGLDNVVPDPIGAYLDAKEENKGDLRAIGTAAGELLEKVPIIGGSAKFGSSLGGIVGEWAELVPEAGEKFAASLDWPNLTEKQREYNIKLIGRAIGYTMGIPFTNQILKSVNVASKGGNPYQIIIGAMREEKKRKGGGGIETIPRFPTPPRPTF